MLARRRPLTHSATATPGLPRTKRSLPTRLRSQWVKPLMSTWLTTPGSSHRAQPTATEGLLRTDHRTGGRQRTHPVFCIVPQASIALCRSNRRRVIGSGGRDGNELDVRTQNNNLCNRSKGFSLIHLDQIWAEPWAT